MWKIWFWRNENLNRWWSKKRNWEGPHPSPQSRPAESCQHYGIQPLKHWLRGLFLHQQLGKLGSTATVLSKSNPLCSASLADRVCWVVFKVHVVDIGGMSKKFFFFFFFNSTNPVCSPVQIISNDRSKKRWWTRKVSHQSLMNGDLNLINS